MGRIELTGEQLDTLVPVALMDAYGMVENDFESQDKLLKAIKTVLKYYMTPSDFKKWKNSLKP